MAVTYLITFQVVPAQRSRFDFSQALSEFCNAVQHDSVRIVADFENSCLSKLSKGSAIRILRIFAEHAIHPRLDGFRCITLNVQDIRVALRRQHCESARPLSVGLQPIENL